MDKKSRTMWAIIGEHGLYAGTSITRKDMIIEHCKAYLWGHRHTKEQIQKRWRKCRKNGDRAIKVEVTPIRSNPTDKLRDAGNPNIPDQ